MVIDKCKRSLALFHFGLDLFMAVNVPSIMKGLDALEMIRKKIVKPIVITFDVFAHLWRVMIILISLITLPNIGWLTMLVLNSGDVLTIIQFILMILFIMGMIKPANKWLKFSKELRKIEFV